MRTAVTIVTGFLGSGKTTLLRHVVEQGLRGRRVALIVNELGEMGFDGQVIEGVNVSRMIELTSGCICCSIGTDFLVAVEEIRMLVEPELIIVETTGVAEPWSLMRQVRAADLPLDAIVTVVDAANVNRELELAAVARQQIRAADFLVLNKCDLATTDQLDAVRALLHSQNDRAAIIETVKGNLAAGLIFGAATLDPQRPLAEPSNHLASDQIETIAWRHDIPLERAQIEAALCELPRQVYRAKGIIHCTDAPWPTLVSQVCGRVDYETTRLKTPPPALNQLVLIGSGLHDQSATLLARLAACADTPDRVADWQRRRDEM